MSQLYLTRQVFSNFLEQSIVHLLNYMDTKSLHVCLGRKVKIWHNVNIYGLPNKVVTIGDETQIGSFTEIKPGVRIGKHCRIQSYVFISDDTKIDDEVFIGPGVFFLNDKYPTTATSGLYNWKVAPPIVLSHASIGGGAVIGPGVIVGKFAVVGMGAVVVNNVPDFTIVTGNPAKSIGRVTQKKYAKLFRLK